MKNSETLVDRRGERERALGRAVGWYYVVMLLLAIIFAVSWYSDADAQTVCPTGAVPSDGARVCWSNAIQFTNGDMIPQDGPTSIATTEIRRSVCKADHTAGTIIETISVPVAIGVALFTALPPAEHCFQARHVLVNGDASTWTNPVRKTTTAPAPPKPKQPNVTVS